MTQELLEKSVADEGTQVFFRALDHYPRLTPEQTLELAKACASGDEEAIANAKADLDFVLERIEIKTEGTYVFDYILIAVVWAALILTFFIMAPTFNEINEKALQPYMKNQITQQAALDRGIEPIRNFMFKQTHEKELALFVRMAKIEKPKTKEDVPTFVLLPSFILSELKTAFTIGFVVYLPFLVIDIVVSSVLVSMGMMFLPPSMIALPFKLIMFVMVDGWYLIVRSLVESFVK